ncbi:MAG: PAS domain S-box protein, partial [Verrucomicrobiae bacterium]|nr:PAS domain S-box protein [Verrucomicrobiae bacterium]
ETFLKYIHPDDRDRLVRAAEAAWRDDVPYDIEHRLIRPDGSVRWVHEMAQIERDEAGHPIRMVGVVRDVTEHREARARLRLQGTALQATANTVMITDRDGHIEWVNAAFERMTGYPTAEVIGKKPSLLKSGRQDSGYYQELWTTILAGKVWEGEMINRRKDGSVYIEESTITPLSDADGRISHFITIKQDVTDRKQADERLRAESAFRRSIIEHAAEGICVWEPIDEAPGAHFSVWNPRMIEMTGYTMEEINRQGWTETMYRDPEEQARAAIRMRKAIDTDCRGSIEITLTHKDGNPRTVILSYRRLDSAETRQRLLVMMIDVTEQRRIERERREIEAQARHRERLAALGTLAGGVAHEINNPVNGIMNYADIIGEGLPADSPLREFVNEIQHETHRVTEIVKNLLSFARQDQAPPHPTGIPEIVEGTLSLVHALFKRDHIHLKVHLDPDLPPLTGHGNRLQQVVMNLMTNARDALNQRFPGHDLEKQLHVEAHALERDGQTWVRLTVEDHGAGIPEEVRQQMFEPFFTTKGREEGTGLGLAISHGIVKEHGGEIRCESEPGRFTRFHVDLPADAPPPPETPGAPAAPGTA